MENLKNENARPGTEFMLVPEELRPEVCCFRKNLTNELSADFTLPDYMPEIRKMLGITAKISPLTCYIGGKNIEFSGRIDYDIIYTGGDGALSSAPLGSDFSFEVTPELQSSFSDGDFTAYADVDTENLHCRVTAPRKLTVKCRLTSLVTAFCREDISMRGGAIERNAECLKREESCGETSRQMSEIIELSDELDTGTPADCTEVVYLNSNAFVQNISDDENGNLNVSGELCVDALYRNSETGELKSDRCRIPFTELMEAAGSTDTQNGAYNVRAICGEVKASPGEEKLLIDAEIILEATRASNKDMRLTEDIFIPGKSCKTEYRNLNLYENVKCENCTFTEKASFSGNELQIGNGSILMTSGAALVTDLDLTGGKAKINGKCRIWVLTENNGEFSAGEVSMPFSYDTGITVSENSNVKINAAPSVANIRIRPSDNGAELEADIMLPYCLTREKTVRVACGIECTEEKAKKKNGVTVYYPPKDERLWDIAKKFGVSLRDLSEANNLSVSEGNAGISGKKYVIIC